MNRIIIHWTGGGNTPNAVDRRAYHFVISGSGEVVAGVHPPEANARLANPNDSSTYAAHVARMNTGSIGVAMAGMTQAVERPFNPGPQPLRWPQIEAMAAHVADLCRRYSIAVTRETVLTHAEVEPTLGVAQRGKWDVVWLPDMSALGDPIEVGDRLRAMVKARIKPATPPEASAPLTGRTPLFGWLVQLFQSLNRRE